jgi:DNA invertase Pin-like site-specific DNA recombinase
MFNVPLATITNIIYNTSYKNDNYIPPARKKYIGENAVKAKLTNSLANEIRKFYNENKISYSKLANKYGISKSMVGDIIRNETYFDKDRKITYETQNS